MQVAQPGVYASGDPKAFVDKPQPTRRGRPKGSRNKMGHDLMDLVMQAAEELGFLKEDRYEPRALHQRDRSVVAEKLLSRSKFVRGLP
jgi:hypothetical protein